MKIRTGVRNLFLSSLLLSVGTADLSAQSAIYACGHIRRTRTTAIDNLRMSGYTTAILFNVNVEKDGTLTTDYSWSSQTPAEAGGVICSDGKYVFDQYQPHYIDDIKALLTQPTSINRIEICIGGWGNGSYGNIRDLVNSEGTGEESALYRNFKALKEAIPEIVAVNNDQEQDYDIASCTAFHRMLAEIGYKTTVAPYMYKEYWQELVAELNSVPGTCDLVYLQTYGGGAGNNPSDWKVFGDVPMYVGFDCEASGDIDAMRSRFENWRDNAGVTGGFLWNYNDERRNLNEWATCINRIFNTCVTDAPVATFYQDANYGGYAVELPEGKFTRPELALYGLKDRDVSSISIKDGYKVTGYTGDDFTGGKTTWEESIDYVGVRWNDKVRTLVIEPVDNSGISEVSDTHEGGLKVESVRGTGRFSVSGAPGNSIQVFSVDGIKVAEVKTDAAGEAVVDLAHVAEGVYMIKSGAWSAKVVKP